MVRLSLLSLLPGCMLLRTEYVTPIGPPEWKYAVEEAINIWEYATGCEIADIGVEDDNNLVILVPYDDWSHGDETIGWTAWNADIEIVGDSSKGKLTILLHEFGHRLGLWHSSIKTSIMYPTPYVKYPSDADIRLAQLLCE